MLCNCIFGGIGSDVILEKVNTCQYLHEAHGGLGHGGGVDPIAESVAVDVGAALDSAAHPAVVVLDVAALVDHEPVGTRVHAVFQRPDVPSRR